MNYRLIYVVGILIISLGWLISLWWFAPWQDILITKINVTVLIIMLITLVITKVLHPWDKDKDADKF